MWNALINFINYIIAIFGTLISFILNLFPSSPFVLLDNSVISEYLPIINFFVPISEILVIVQGWLVCITIYYIYQTALRWAKVIQ